MYEQITFYRRVFKGIAAARRFSKGVGLDPLFR